MPTKITRYVCDICGESYKTKAEAVACEAQGLGTDKPYNKIGMIFEFRGHPLAIKASNNHPRFKHQLQISIISVDHPLFKEVLSLIRFGQMKDEWFIKPNHATSEFQTLVDMVKEAGLTPTVWDGSKPVSVKECLTEWCENNVPEGLKRTLLFKIKIK